MAILIIFALIVLVAGLALAGTWVYCYAFRDNIRFPRQKRKDA